MQRVAHYMNTCFNRTETFIYDFANGCRRYESWCLAPRIIAQSGFDFPRVRRTSIGWDKWTLWDLYDRACYRFTRRADTAFCRIMRQLKPAILHAHFGDAGWDVLPIARRFGVPLVTSFYGFDASSLPQKPGWMERLKTLFLEGDAFLVEGPVMGKRLESLGCPAEKIRVIPITIHTDRYSFRPRTLSQGEKLRLLFIGRFVPKKGLPILLNALFMVKDKLVPFELYVIGGGDAENEMRNMVSEKGLDDSVRFLGYQSRTDMVEAMNNSHVLVVPSVTAPDGDTEGGAPTVILEAQASGLLVLGTDHADIPFVVAGLYRQYLAKEGSAKSLSEQLLALKSVQSSWPDFSDDGRKQVIHQHSDANFERLESMYDFTILNYKRRVAHSYSAARSGVTI